MVKESSPTVISMLELPAPEKFVGANVPNGTLAGLAAIPVPGIPEIANFAPLIFISCPAT